jgi:hypothetical protein
MQKNHGAGYSPPRGGQTKDQPYQRPIPSVDILPALLQQGKIERLIFKWPDEEREDQMGQRGCELSPEYAEIRRARLGGCFSTPAVE